MPSVLVFFSWVVTGPCSVDLEEGFSPCMNRLLNLVRTGTGMASALCCYWVSQVKLWSGENFGRHNGAGHHSQIVLRTSVWQWRKLDDVAWSMLLYADHHCPQRL